MADIDPQWNNPTVPLLGFVLVTPANTDLERGVTKAILLSADDTVTILSFDGDTVALPLAGKVAHRIAATRIISMAGAATVHACY